MSTTTIILGGIVTAVVSGVLVGGLTGLSYVKNNHCKERRNACFSLLVQKIDGLSKDIDWIKKEYLRRFGGT